MGDVPTLDTWTTGQRVGALQLNNNVYRPAALLTQPPSAGVMLSSNQAHTTTSTTETVSMTLVVWDTDSMAYGDGLRIRTPGLYQVTGLVTFDQATSSGHFAVRLLLNGSSVNSDYVNRGAYEISAASPNISLPFFVEVECDAGDVLTVRGWQNYTANHDMIGSSDPADIGTACHLTATWVATNDTTTGTETAPLTWTITDTPTAAQFNTHIRDEMKFLLSPPRCRLSQTSAQSVSPATNTDLTLGVEDWDPYSMGASNTITLSDDGLWLVQAHMTCETSSPAGRRELKIRHLQSDGSTLIREYKTSQAANPAGNHNSLIAAVINANDGEKLKLRYWHNRGLSVNVNHGWLSARWLGVSPS